jgi:type I restriction enzyme S subunit
MPLPLPPIDEIRHLTGKLDAHLASRDEVALTLRQEVIDSEALRQSILKAAFEGRLVPQDPSDEPASALLARLRGSSRPDTRSRRRRPRQYRLDR